jgi:hypothetical protein
MKKLLLILLCVPLIFSCGNNKKDKRSGKSEETWQKFAKIVKDECIKGNEGNTDWQAYCDCGSENFMATIKDMDLKEVSKMPEEELMMMGMEAGLDCVHLIENNDVVQTDEMEEMMYRMLYNECLSGEEGNSDMEEYCECAAKNMMEAVPNIEDWEDLSDEDAMEIGMQAGMECLHYLE